MSSASYADLQYTNDAPPRIYATSIPATPELATYQFIVMGIDYFDNNTSMLSESSWLSLTAEFMLGNCDMTLQTSPNLQTTSITVLRQIQPNFQIPDGSNNFNMFENADGLYCGTDSYSQTLDIGDLAGGFSTADRINIARTMNDGDVYTLIYDATWTIGSVTPVTVNYPGEL